MSFPLFIDTILREGYHLRVTWISSPSTTRLADIYDSTVKTNITTGYIIEVGISVTVNGS